MTPPRSSVSKSKGKSRDILPTAITDETRQGEVFRANRRAVSERMEQIRTRELELMAGGGPKRIEAQHKKGRLTVRERIGELIDPGSAFIELGIHAASGLYDDKAPAAGVVCGLAPTMRRSPAGLFSR